MSENPFRHCLDGRTVLFTYHAKRGFPPNEAAEYTLADQALARIRELTPRTVTAEQRERAKSVLRGWTYGRTDSAYADVLARIIDALGYADPEPAPAADALPPTCCDQINPCAEHQPAPAVEAVDMVNHPPHYRHPSGVECITITEHCNFCIGNAIKYLWRADEKGSPVEDLRKARWYIDREIARRIGGDQ